MLTKLLLTLLIPISSMSPRVALTEDGGTILGARTDTHWEKMNKNALEPIISAPSAVVIDADSGKILYKKNHTQVRPIASITKLVSAYAYLEETGHNLSDIISLQKSDIRSSGQHGVYLNEQGSAFDFLHLALIGSDNSAAVALVRSGGFLETYAEKIQSITQGLQLHNTTLVEPTGLSEENTSTALEVALLARTILKDTNLSGITIKPEYVFSPIGTGVLRKVTATNDLIQTNLFTIRGGKTGFTESAGYCLVLRVQGADNKELIISVLGSPTDESRFQDAKTLAWWVLENFK